MQTYDRRGDNASIVALVGLAVVVIALLTAVWWWTRGVWGDFSVPLLEYAASFVRYGKPERPLVGYEPEPAPAEGAAPAEVPSAATAAPFCTPGQAPTFVLGFAELERRLGSTMGEPFECEHVDAGTGDTLQLTTTGLAVYRHDTGELSFTDGWRHWALAGGQLVTWEGADKPPPSTPIASTALGRARVANTDGLGVALRNAPRSDAWTPQALPEGAEVNVLERAGADWVRVHAVRSGLEGWVPVRYLAPLN